MASLELQSLQETLSENSIETVADLKSLSRSNEDMQELGFSAEQLTRLVAWGSGKPVKRSVEAIEAKEAMEAKRATAAAASAAAAAAAAVPTPTDEGFQNSEGDTDFQTRMRKDAPTGQARAPQSICARGFGRVGHTLLRCCYIATAAATIVTVWRVDYFAQVDYKAQLSILYKVHMTPGSRPLPQPIEPNRGTHIEGTA